MKRVLRTLFLLLTILAIVGVFNTPLTTTPVVYADGAGDPTPKPPRPPANQ